jgi:hypothetical protein
MQKNGLSDPGTIKKLSDEIISRQTENLLDMASARENGTTNPLTHEVHNYAPPSGVTMVNVAAANITSDQQGYAASVVHGLDPKALGVGEYLDRLAVGGNANMNSKGEFTGGGVDVTGVKVIAGDPAKTAAYLAGGVHIAADREGKVAASGDLLGVISHNAGDGVRLGAYAGANLKSDLNMTEFIRGELKLNADTPYSTNLAAGVATDEFKKGSTSVGFRAIQNVSTNVMIGAGVNIPVGSGETVYGADVTVRF